MAGLCICRNVSRAPIDNSNTLVFASVVFYTAIFTLIKAFALAYTPIPVLVKVLVLFRLTLKA